ncbi:MAG: NAD(P)-dependent oxidoreductase [Betaproteobacteria bacterium]|nr:NAD(P)-dependent oxidoreductase [Betaproteobacteria bacterium]
MSQEIGFIGMGKIGVPMARRIAASGRRLRVHDISEQAVRAACSAIQGATSDSLQNIGAQCDVIILMLPDSPAVKAVLLGNGGKGLIENLRKGSIVIDMSSSDPSATRELGEVLHQRGIAFLDAPVSGGVKRAVNGTLSIMVGGDPDTIAQIKDLLLTMGTTVTETGALGSAHAMKALNNYVSATGLVAACEALKIGQAFGIDAKDIVAILNTSTGKNNATENKLMQFIVSGKFDSGFSLGLMKKDLTIAMGLAKSVNTPTAIGDSVLDAWRRADELLGPGADHTEIYRVLESTGLKT